MPIVTADPAPQTDPLSVHTLSVDQQGRPISMAFASLMAGLERFPAIAAACESLLTATRRGAGSVPRGGSNLTHCPQTRLVPPGPAPAHAA